MTQTIDADRKKIIDKVVNYAKKKTAADQFLILKAFIQQYYANAPLEDLAERAPSDLFGAVESHWEFMQVREPNEYKRRIFNPDLSTHGWQSKYSVLEIIVDDQPFLVDTLAMELNRLGYTIHFLVSIGGIKIKRDKKNRIMEVFPYNADVKDVVREAPIYMEIDKQIDESIQKELLLKLDDVIKDARAAVGDWNAMQQRVNEAIHELEQATSALEPDEIEESKSFLRWLLNDHFTFLGSREYEVVKESGEKKLALIPRSGLGILRDKSKSRVAKDFENITQEAYELENPHQAIIFTKTNTRSTVHSARYAEGIIVKRYDKQGNIVGEFRFIGLYTSTAYHSNTAMIPIIRRKVKNVLERSGLPYRGHASKVLLNILETLPRDDVYQASVDDLYQLAMGIYQLQDRRKIRLFVYMDAFQRYVSCLVYVPRDDYSTELRNKMQELLMETFHGMEVSYDTFFSDSILARIHFNIRLPMSHVPTYNLKEIESQLVQIGRSWRDDLQEYLIERFGESRGLELFHRYRSAFPAGYRETFSARSAAFDVEFIEKLSPHNLLEMSLYRPHDVPPNITRFKLFRAEYTIPLSDVMPVLENMGLRVIGEQPYELVFSDGSNVWINDFLLTYPAEMVLNIQECRHNFQELFSKVWHGEAENDRFNQLILRTDVNWRDIVMLRAYAKYLKQLNFTLSQAYIEDTLSRNPQIVKLIVQLFHHRFDPALQESSVEKSFALENEILAQLENVANLDEDRILRIYVQLVKATLRTNYFQENSEGYPKPYLSFKFDPSEIQEMPLPKPMYEIFVYSPRFEGIHLRANKVARGGLRWSDRREDFRTEILGLMKAQQVKNAVIVPAGAKGGFVPKHLQFEAGREAVLEEAISCYKNFIRGLLDITDNLLGDDVVHPENTIYYDEDDPYLVVAADKGTATFSDIANSIAKEYSFWLGDAFASGGSAGYDHKKMGITARGAWESVKNHFQELGVDTQTTDFTVVGIGDMAGDVFGNGMLLSEHIKLVAAFNHENIFIDPDPNPKTSFKERQRLFNLPRSSWEDYKSDLISKGGGVFKRSAKAIKLSPEVRNLFKIKKDTLTPNELIRAIMKSPFDLLWNGGIGTFVKASTETQADAADRANDAIRLNADELTCKVVGEGGNLGFTQLARIEYALRGGKINTDFIDNSGGVDCSDHEVNIKILLNAVVESGKLSEKQRNVLLAQMTDEVAALVLHNNYRQARAIGLAASQSLDYITLYMRYIADKVSEKKIDRRLEFLPDDKALLERKANGHGLTRPEVAVLSAYSKILLKEDILNSYLPEDPYFVRYLEMAFPNILVKRYPQEMTKHRLCREIIATQLSNSVITDMGVTFVYQMYDETRSSSADIVKCYVISHEIFKFTEFWQEISQLDNKIAPDVQVKMILEMVRLSRRSTRWFLRNQRTDLDVNLTVDLYSKYVEKIYKNLPRWLVGKDKEYLEIKKEELLAAGVPLEMAVRIASARAMYSSLNIVEAATEYNIDANQVASLYFTLADLLGLDEFREMINDYPVDTRWSVLARSAVKGDLDYLQRILTIGVLKVDPKIKDQEKLIALWSDKQKILIDRWQETFAELRTITSLEYSMLAVAMRDLLDLSQASLYGTTNPGYKHMTEMEASGAV